MCGMNAADCKKNSTLFALPVADIILRPSELEALVAPALSSALAQETTQPVAQPRITVTTSPISNPDAVYTPGQMAGLGVGFAIPLLIVSGIAILLWRKDRARTPKLMYPLPDDLADPYTSRDGTPLHTGATSLRPPLSRNGSVLSSNTTSGDTPVHMQTFAERYQLMKGTSGLQIQRVELDACPGGDYGNHELHDLKVPIPKEF